MTLPWVPALPIVTERMVLRAHRPEDLDDLLVFHSDPEVVRYIPWPARSRGETRDALEMKLGQYRVDQPDTALVLAMEFEGTVIGEVLLKCHDDEHAELGYAMNPAFGGRGLATEAASAMLRLAFDDLGVQRVTATLDERNAASARLLERVGMTLARRYQSQFKGETITELEYELAR